MVSPSRDRPENVEDLGDRGPRSARGDAPTFTLIRRLADEVTTLFAKELALLRLETKTALSGTRAGIGAVAVGGAVAFAGFLFVLAAATFALMLVWPAWAAAVTVGGPVTIIGMIMLSSGRRKLDASAFNPEHTRASLQKDRQLMGRSVHEPH